MEICQRVAKLAIRASIDADIWAAKREAEDAKMEDDSKEAEDPVPQITRLAFIVITSLYSLTYTFFRQDFEEVMKFAHRSMSNQDIRRCEMFSQYLHLC